MWQLIEENKRKSFILIIFLVLLFVVFGTTLMGALFEDNYQKGDCLGSLIGLGISLFSAICVIFYAKTKASNFFLEIAGAVPLENNLLDKTLKNIVEEMSIAASLGFTPKIYIIDSKTPNAFAVGVNQKNAAVAVTTGLLSVLSRDELTGVIAHEISHIKNQDTLYLMYAGVIFGIIITLSDILWRSLRYSSRRSSKGGGGFALIAIILAILSPICAKLLYLSVSRKREFLADACACQYTRYPKGLAGALRKISNFKYVSDDIQEEDDDEFYEDEDEDIRVDEKENSHKIISCMYIHNHLQKRAKNFLDNLFSTHPPIEKRIQILRKMSHADMVEYNNIYSSTLKKNLLKKRALVDINPLNIVVPLVVEENKIERQRAAKSAYKKAKNYRIINCQCQTALKIPPEFKKETVTCPHCKKIYKI